MNELITDERAAELLALDDFEPGPWVAEIDVCYGEMPRVYSADRLVTEVGNASATLDDFIADACLIAAAPELLSLARQRAEERDALRAEIARLKRDHAMEMLASTGETQMALDEVARLTAERDAADPQPLRIQQWHRYRSRDRSTFVQYLPRYAGGIWVWTGDDGCSRDDDGRLYSETDSKEDAIEDLGLIPEDERDIYRTAVCALPLRETPEAPGEDE